MADDQQENAEKTEEPTAKRISEAVKKGQVAFSREVSSFLMILVLALNIAWFAPYYSKKALGSFSRFITEAHDIRVDTGSFVTLFAEVASDLGMILFLPIGATVVVAFLSTLLQNGVVISPEKLMPKLEKISLFKGIKRLFSLRSFVEFIKGIIKISIVAIASYLTVRGDLNKVQNLVSHDVAGIIAILTALALKIVIAAASVMFVIALLDFLYQKFEYIKSLRMTKQELKEEFKQTEGDPQIKGKLRQIRMERAKQRMMAAVPDSDVVIRNPEHYAIALKYDDKVMEAPFVTAMGQDDLAMRIIGVAEEHNIPIVRNPPLARALFSSAKLDEEIPLDHYQAVAEVIGYIFRLKGKLKTAA